MIRIKSLRLSITLQFITIIAPFAVVLLFQAYSDFQSVNAVRFEQDTAARAREARDGYKLFGNRVADAVDTGSISGTAVGHLDQVKKSLLTLRGIEERYGTSLPQVGVAVDDLSLDLIER